MQGRMAMDQHALLDMLSEFLALEHSAVHLFQTLINRTEDRELRRRVEAFGTESQRHIDVLVRLIQELQGDPLYVSPMARLAKARVDKLVEVALLVDGLTPDQVTWLDLQSLLFAKSQDHFNWSTLRQLADLVTDDRQRQALQRAASEVEPQVHEHLSWARETLRRHTAGLLQTEPATEWLNYITTPQENIRAEHPAPIGGPLLIPPPR